MMVLDTLLAGIWFVNVYVPATRLDVRASGEEPKQLLSASGVGAQFGYGFTPSIEAFAEYETNYSFQTRNVYLNGFDAGTRFYLMGEKGTLSQNALVSSFVAPRNSIALSLIGLQRSFNLQEGTTSATTQKKNGIVLDKAYALTGNFFAFGSSLSFERVVVGQNLRLVCEALAAQSLSVTTAIKFTLFQGRLGLSYQM